MRIPFNEVLKNADFDIGLEYNRLYKLFYEEQNAGVYTTPNNHKFVSTYTFFNDASIFRSLKIRGTALSLQDFDETHKINYKSNPHTDDLDELVGFCEYIINIILSYPNLKTDNRITRTAGIFAEQIDRIIEAIGYQTKKKDNVMLFFPKDVVSMTVSEILPKSISYKVIFYNHHSLKGQIEEKKKIIKSLADLLEPKRKQLKEINPSLETELFNSFNNFDIRHNNREPTAKNYNHIFDTITPEELEELYDDVYQLCLLAFVELDNVERKRKINNLLKEKNTKTEIKE